MAKVLNTPASIDPDFWRITQNDPTDHELAISNGRTRVKSPEHALVLAVIEDAVYVLREGPKACPSAFKARVLAETVRWFESDSEDLFSFAWCCGVVGWDVEWIRKGVLEQN